jgi:serine/threonine protein kinase
VLGAWGKPFSKLESTNSPQLTHELDSEAKGMKMDAARTFRDALLGVKVLHDKDWLHCDLKPANIGILHEAGLPRSVLLDIGSCRHLVRGSWLQPNPGRQGTIGYLAPEFEQRTYDHSIDIWAMGVILFELTYNIHPWKIAENPWRTGNETLRPIFAKMYQDALDRMTEDYESAHESPTEGYIHRECSRNISQSVNGVSWQMG